MKKQYHFFKKFLIRSIGLVALITAPFTGLKSQIYINEIMTGNTSMFMDPSNNYGGWIEIYNAGDQIPMLYGYTITDDLSNPRKFRLTTLRGIPSKGFVQIWFDNNELNAEHVDFKLSHDGGVIALFDLNGNEAARLEYPAQVQNVSYARTTDGGDEWGYCITPTPKESNNGSTFAYERCPEPTISLTGGVYNSAVNVKIECPSGMEIRYTTDCSEPNSSSPLWPSGTTRNFSSTTIIRARVMAANYMDGPISTQSYIISNREFTLPVTSIVTTPANLWDDMIGIYVVGKNGKPGNGQNIPCNWNMDWSRPANFEYLNGSDQLFSQEIDIAIGGGWTRAYNSTKSLKLRAEKKYDMKNKFDYSFFPAKPNLKFKGLYLRSSGNDFNSTMMRDAVQHCFIEGVLDVEYQAYVPTIHYLNGVYYGIINLRERSNQQYVYSNFGYDKDEIDLIEQVPDGYEVSNGTEAAMTSLLRLSANASNASVYQEIEQLMDIDEFIAYLIVEMYSGNNDWPQNNTKVFRHQDNGKFRWVLYDLDDGIVDYNRDPFSRMASASSAIHSVSLFRNLIKNETFKHRFIDYFTLTLGSVYQPDRINQIIDSVSGMIRTEARQSGSHAGSLDWGVASFKNFANVRPDRLIPMMRNYFNLGEPVKFTISSNLPHATIHVNDVPVPLGASDGYTFTNKEMTVKAITPTGYEFAGWRVLNENSGQVILSYGSDWSYYDQGSLDGTQWKEASYNVSSWNSGRAPLGYGNNQIVTLMDYGTDSSNKRPTYYLRKTLELPEWTNEDRFSMNLVVDDGAVVYINGTEVVRHLMPAGTISYETWASTYAPGNPDNAIYSIPASVFKKGTNVIAVEVHQHEGPSSDVYLDLQLMQSSLTSGGSYPDQEITFLMDGPLNIQAEFVKKETDPNHPLPLVRINEVSASNDIYVNEYYKAEDWIELYNTSDQPVSIAGLYISREPENPKYYQIPEGPESETLIPPFGFRVLWADREEDNTQLHLPFKLAGEGGTLTLTSFTTDASGNEIVEWSDQLTYTRHSSDHTFGRYPDGSEDLYIMHRTSFAAPNIFSFLSEYVTDGTSIEEITTGSGLEESGISLFYDGSTLELTVQMQEASARDQELYIYNLPGQIMGQYTLPAGQSSYILPLHDLPAGYHIAVIHTSGGQRVTFRFIR